MDFYKRKDRLLTNTKQFLEARQNGSKIPWAEFVRKQKLELHLSERIINEYVQLIDPKIIVENGELVKKE